MIAVEEAELGVIFPSDRVRMVLMQPYVELPNQEPFRWLPEKTQGQLERIRTTLRLALAPGHDVPVASITVFPEYSVPGLVGLDAIEDELGRAPCPSGTVVIAGLHGLSHAEYAQLWGRGLEHLPAASNPNNTVGRWVNCNVVLAKKTDEPVRRWIQPKLRRCREEANCPNLLMFEGGMVYLFASRFDNGPVCRFLVLSCFDWIAPDGAGTLPSEVLVALSEKWRATGQQSVDFVFVPQWNPLPNDHRFLQSAHDFFVRAPNHPLVNRDSCVLVFANTAGKDTPGHCLRYGGSSLFFAPTLAQTKYDFTGCPPTYGLYNTRARGQDTLGPCGDVLLREHGACVHSFLLRPPMSVRPDNADRRWPLLDDAAVHALNATEDLRAPGGIVPAVVKWTNDELDAVQPTGRALNVQNLRGELDEACGRVTQAIRRKEASRQSLCPYAASTSVDVASKTRKVQDKSIRIVDLWDHEETQGLECAVRALSILDVFERLDVAGSPAHAVMQVGGSDYQVVVVSSQSHEECYSFAQEVRRRLGNVVILLISRARIGRPDFPSRLSILDGPDTANITNDDSWVKPLGYYDLVHVACNAANVDQFRTELRPLLLGEGRNPADAA
jgi:hypothetical protein